MANPGVLLRGGPSGPTFAPSTAGYVLTVQADGRTVKPMPGGGGGGAVSSVFGRADVVVAQAGDYDVSQLAGAGYTANQYAAWNGAAFAAATPLASPQNPADNGKVPVVASGDFSYVAVTALFGAQNVVTTGAVLIGATPARAGDLRVKHGHIANARNSGDSADVRLWDFGATTVDTFTIGAAATPLQVLCLNGFSLQSGSGLTLWFQTQVRTSIPAYEFSGTDGEIRGQDNAVPAATGGKVSVRGTNCTGTTSIGGDVRLSPGTGTAQNGTGTLSAGANYALTCLRWNTIAGVGGLGLFGANPIVQPPRVGQLTDNSGGAATGAVAAAPAIYAAVNLNDIHASILAKLNGIEARLSQAAAGIGLTA